MSTIISKADLRSVMAIVIIGTFIGSWVYFLSVVPIDTAKPLDATVMLIAMMGVIQGTVIGVFAWLGFKQGTPASQQPTTTT